MPNINAVTNTFDIETTGTLYIDAIGSASDAGITLALGTDAGDDFNVGSGKFVVEGDTSYVGIGRATPAGKLEVYAGQMVATNGAFALSKFNSQGVAWSSVPTLSSLVFNGGSSDRPEISWIRGGDSYPEFAIRQHTTADQGCQIYCGTGSSAPIESMAITIGGVAIGTSLPSATLHVDQSSATGAQPVLLLDQADDSEEMVEFTGTVGVGNAIEAVGAKTLTTTHFIKITITGVGTRYIPAGTIA